MSHDQTQTTPRDHVGQVARVLVLEGAGGDGVAGDGPGAALSRASAVSTSTAQHGVSVVSECDSVISGMLRSAEEDVVDPSADLGADLQHIEEWLKTRSDSLSSFDFDAPEMKPSEVDISDFFSLKSGGTQVSAGDGGGDPGGAVGVLLPEAEGPVGRRQSFTRRLETLMQVDKGLFEELLLTDPGKKQSGRRGDLGPGLANDDRGGLFEELLLPEDWTRHAQELLLAVSLEKREGAGDEAAPTTTAPPDIDLMGRVVQPIKLMSPQELENMVSRPLGFEETPIIKDESPRSSQEGSNHLEEDFNFLPFSGGGGEDAGVLGGADLLPSEVDSKLSSILALDASNEPLEVGSASDMLDSLGSVAGGPRMERSVSPGTFLVKLEPSQEPQAAPMPPPQAPAPASSCPSLPSTVSSLPSNLPSVSAAGNLPSIVSAPNTISGPSNLSSTLSSLSSTPSSLSSPILAPRSLVLAVSGSTSGKMVGGMAPNTSQAPNNNSTQTLLRVVPSIGSATTAPGVVRLPLGTVRAELKKMPMGVVQLKLAGASTQGHSPAASSSSNSSSSSKNPAPQSALILRPLVPSSQGKGKEGGPVTLTPVRMVGAGPGVARVSMTVDRRNNQTTVSVVSSNREHTVFRINTGDLLRAVASIREPHLAPLGLTPQQLLRSAHTANRLVQQVQQQQQNGPLPAGPHNYEINQTLQEVRTPISRAQQGQLALLQQAAPLVGDATTSSDPGSLPLLPTSTTTSTSTSFTPTLTSPAFILPSTASSGVTKLVVPKMDMATTMCPSTSQSEPRLPRSSLLTPDKSAGKGGEGVGVSLRPGAPPTMVSVPSVLDALSASSPPPPSPPTTSAPPSEDDLNDENPDMCALSEEMANKELEKLGIRVEALQCEPWPQGGKRWPCPIKGCSKLFPKLSSLKIHLLSHNGVRPYKCSYENCDWSFFTWFKLKRHIETHLKRRDWVCPEANCRRRFTTVYNLKTHQRLHERPKSWMCALPECSQAFRTRRELEAHMKEHKDVEAPYKCRVEGCLKSYFTPNSLTSHMRSHHKEEELRCQWVDCGKKFDKPCRLKAHQRVHTGQRPFVCTYQGCTWSFQSASKLSRHQRKHTNDRKFTCSICQKSFLRSEHLKGHLLIHTGERKFQCPIEHCNAKFTAKSSLYVHLKKHEGKGGSTKVAYHCPIDTCNTSYTSKFHLRQHMLKNHTIYTADSSQLDYITLLGEKELELLPLTTGGGSAPTTSATLDPSLGAPDPHGTLLSSIELISGDVVEGPSMPPLVVMEDQGGGEGLDLGVAEGEGGGGSARTDVLGNILRSQRAKKRQKQHLAKKLAAATAGLAADHCGSEVMSFANDVVLSASAVTTHLQAPLLQDDVELYQEGLMDHDDLLSDPSTNPQSTINLRDLE